MIDNLDPASQRCGIYVIRNIVNNKKYIGQSKNIPHRLTVHQSKLKHNKHHNKHLQRAYNAYGGEFEFYVIEYCLLEDVGFKEMFWIDFWQTCNPEFGYNLTSGGEESLPSRETRQKMSAARLGVRPGSYGKPLSDARRAQISEWAKQNNILPPITRIVGNATESSRKSKRECGSLHFGYGKKLSEATKRKIGEGQRSHQKRTVPVQATTLDGKHLAYYRNMSEAARINQISVVGINRCSNGIIKSSYGCLWNRVPDNISGSVEFDTVPVLNSDEADPVYVLQMNSNYDSVAIYSSALCASIAVDRSDASIRDALLGRSASCAGYFWKYVSIAEYEEAYTSFKIIRRGDLQNAS